MRVSLGPVHMSQSISQLSWAAQSVELVWIQFNESGKVLLISAKGGFHAIWEHVINISMVEHQCAGFEGPGFS